MDCSNGYKQLHIDGVSAHCEDTAWDTNHCCKLLTCHATGNADNSFLMHKHLSHVYICLQFTVSLKFLKYNKVNIPLSGKGSKCNLAP